MRRIAGTALVLLLVGCGGDGGNGPGDANVEGNWIITFTSSGSCTLSQIGLILLADGTTPSEGRTVPTRLPAPDSSRPACRPARSPRTR